MKRFVFRLDSVLRLREFELDQARIALAELERERSRRMAVLHDASVRLDRGCALLAAESAEGADAERLALRADGVTVGRMRVQQAQVALAELDPALQEARERVRHTRSRVRSLERLREQRSDQHRRESLAAEQAELEELAMARVTGTHDRLQRADEEMLG